MSVDIFVCMKTTIDFERQTAEQAARILGTRTLKETVNAALKEVVAAEYRRRLAERVQAGRLPVPSPSELRRLRKPKIDVTGQPQLRL